jgi:hypothetical protein
MLVEGRRERPAVLSTEVLEQLMLRHGLFHKDGIDQHQAVLDELEAERRDFLLLATIRRKEPLATLANEVVRFVPALHAI